MANQLEDLELLNAVIQLGSFTVAAAHTGTTQSRVSRAVARLEEEVGVPLVKRSSRGVAATESGRTYAAFARRVLSELGAVVFVLLLAFELRSKATLEHSLSVHPLRLGAGCLPLWSLHSVAHTKMLCSTGRWGHVVWT